MKKRSRNNKHRIRHNDDDNIVMLNTDHQARMEGPKKKRWSIHDLKHIQPLTDAQADMHQSWLQGDNVFAAGSAGTGKAQPLTSKILTPLGWKRMGELKVGDTITAGDGSDTKVTGIFPQGEKDIYKIIFHDGSSTECCEEHLWEIYAPLKPKQLAVKQIISTNEIKNLINLNVSVWVPLIGKYEGFEQKLPIEPYFLGALLGGGMTNDQLSFTTSDSQQINLLNEVTDKYIFNKTNNDPYVYRITTPENPQGNDIVNEQRTPLKIKLNELGLMGKKSEKKFIPNEYLMSSYDQRLSILQGLLDTNGTVNISKNDKSRNVTFTSTSELLANGVRDLVRSLGGTATVTTRNPTITYKGAKKLGLLSYTVFISHPTPKILFRLDQKIEKCNEVYDNGKTPLRKKITAIEFIGRDDAQCIMVDNDDRLYVTDDYTVTHNTFVALYLAFNEMLESGDYEQIIIVRSAVAARDIGHLPGTKQEKEEIFELPYHDICHELFGRKSTYKNMKEANKVKFMTTSHIRGLTWDNVIVVVDEIQNMGFDEINSIMTRIGKNSKIILCGDDKAQCDLKRHEQTGVHQLLKIVDKIDNFTSIEFTSEDIIRSGFCKDWIIASEEVLSN